MPNLKMEIERQEQRGPDTFLTIKVCESEEDGGASIAVDVTLHNVQCDRVKIEQGGVIFYTPAPDNAPCILRIGAPISAPFL